MKWKCDEGVGGPKSHDVSINIEDSDGTYICSVDGSKEPERNPGWRSVKEANKIANLISAAPDLLSAAEAALDFIYTGKPNNQARALELAIQKAKKGF